MRCNEFRHFSPLVLLNNLVTTKNECFERSRHHASFFLLQTVTKSGLSHRHVQRRHRLRLPSRPLRRGQHSRRMLQATWGINKRMLQIRNHNNYHLLFAADKRKSKSHYCLVSWPFHPFRQHMIIQYKTFLLSLFDGLQIQSTPSRRTSKTPRPQPALTSSYSSWPQPQPQPAQSPSSSPPSHLAYQS